MKKEDRKSFEDTEDLIGRDIQDILNKKGGQVFEDQDRAEKRKKEKRKKSRIYLVISYGFTALFVLLMGYLVYFNVCLKDDVLKSTYNKRQDSQADYVVRGSIESADGNVLARTDVDSEGNETRVYPYGRLFAHVVGYVNNGKSGLETEENYTLLTAHNNLVDHVVNDFLDQKNPGDTVVTTLNTSLQQTAYDALGDHQGAVVAIEPKTGKILCMVSKPDFDPNTLASDWEGLVSDSSASNLVNRATQGKYAPGSVFKIVTAYAYYREHGSFDGFSYDCTGEITEDGHTVHCFQGEVHGHLDFKTAFAESCNCAFIRMGLDLGADKLREAAEILLFNQKLPCDLNYNRASFSVDGTSDVFELMQASFGQGTTLATPYQLALAVSAIANKGVLMKPMLVSWVKNAGGDQVSQKGAEAYSQLISADEAEALLWLMKAVVSEGTASYLRDCGFDAAGKTGTADVVRQDGTSSVNSWFVGILNPDDPDLVVAVIAEGGGAGSETAVPIAAALFSTYSSLAQ